MPSEYALHELKTHPQPFQAVLDGTKPFEIRKNDRGFKVGDRLFLREFDPNLEVYSGRAMVVEVTCLLENAWGLPPGLCVMGIRIPMPEGMAELRKDLANETANFLRAVEHNEILSQDRAARIRERDGLLARVHRDGGQYLAEHGATRALFDADAIVANLYQERDTLALREEALRALLKEVEFIPVEEDVNRCHWCGDDASRLERPEMFQGPFGGQSAHMPSCPLAGMLKD